MRAKIVYNEKKEDFNNIYDVLMKGDLTAVSSMKTKFNILRRSL